MVPPSPSPDVTEALAGFPAAYARTARFSHGAPRSFTVGENGRVFFCRSSGPDQGTLALWTVEPDGTERLLVDPTDLGADEAELPAAERARRERARESAGGIVSYAIDRAGTAVVFVLAGALFRYDLATDRLDAVATDEAVFDPRPSPDGSAVAYVDGRGALHRVDLGPPAVDRVLRYEDDPLVAHGRAEFIAAEEMGRMHGFWWSPDGTGLLATRVDENPVAEWWIADPARPDRPPHPVRYPAAGTANARVGLEFIGADGTVTVIDWDDAGAFAYLVDVVWTAGRPPLVVRQTRDQRLVSVAVVDTSTGAVAERQAIRHPDWVDLVPGTPRWSAAGLVTVEDHGAARRLCLDGRPLTGDRLQVRRLVGVADEATALVLASVGDPTATVLAVVDLGDGSHSVLTPEDSVVNAVLGGGGGGAAPTVLVSSATATATRSTSSVTSLGTDRRLARPRAVLTNRAADPGFAPDPTFLFLGERRLPTAVFLPSDHDGESPLPVLLDPYGGPTAQRAVRSGQAHLVSRWFAEQGYAVAVTDGRGTPGRGPDWEHAVASDLATPVLDDQIDALDALAGRLPFLDLDRVGIRGWSFGGYLAAVAVLRRPDRFHAAVAGAPVTRWEWYDTHYTERYLGVPADAPAAYRRSNVFAEAAPVPERHRPLLLIHGLADDNVVAMHTLRLSTVLLAAGYPHQVLPLSGVTHMTPQVAVAENLLRFQLRFLDTALGRRDGEASP
ncbi:MAG: prolyl oligopeptidase family serine peptidase [Acidimicrobiales bacterium]